ncbi:MAG: ADP-ribosylglycohydrolase family protein [Caldilineaceae bacterium]|nr:ADP-ribosylglycohydrolase family protein [Caldilineaceae bacterium]
MTTSYKSYSEATYAGVLGKLIGVYLGRPVEGWPYESIEARFGAVDNYVHEALGMPLIVADDDISGTFGFYRAVEESDYADPLMPAHVGDAWLNAIIKDKTILWWGGLGRSTEHTAWLRLKAGIPAPDSGSIALNGPILAEQIGAQIFIDAFAMSCPGDPERATAMIRAAASVSHDGLAVDAAAFLGALEALAFDIRDLDQLLEAALPFARGMHLRNLIDDVRTICYGETDWRRARARLDEKHGYHRHAGPCPMATNHAATLMALFLGGDSFQRSVMIAASAGWDTDCNAGNVGCLNGIRLGLDAINAEADLRTPVADRMYVVTSDGGSCVTDAVLQTRRILRAAARYRGESVPPAAPRFGFEFRGSRQGFVYCPFVKQPHPALTLSNLNEISDENGLLLTYQNLTPNAPAAISTPVFLDFTELARNFSTIGSPTLYPTQSVEVGLRTFAAQNPRLRLYLLYYNQDDDLIRWNGDAYPLAEGDNLLRWNLPGLDGMPILRLGLELLPAQPQQAEVSAGRLAVTSLDWSGAPENFVQQGMLMRSIWNVTPHWLQAWVSSAENFAPDFKYTYCISHPTENGVVTLGTTDWRDYAVTSTLSFSLHQAGGLVIRTQGHRRYYAALFSGGNTLSLVRRINDDMHIIAQTPFEYEEERQYQVTLQAQGNALQVSIDGLTLLQTTDESRALPCGGAGFVIESGTMLADGFAVRRLTDEAPL